MTPATDLHVGPLKTTMMKKPTADAAFFFLTTVKNAALLHVLIDKENTTERKSEFSFAKSEYCDKHYLLFESQHHRAQ